MSNVLNGPPGHERGSALLLALVATSLLMALGLGLVSLGNTEAVIASNYRAGSQSFYAADAAFERVMADLGVMNDWSAVVAGMAHSGFTDRTLTPVLASGQQLDLTRLTAAVQAASNATAVWGGNNPVWRLFAYGRLGDMAPAVMDSDEYLVVWVADDPGETDNNPAIDGNGVVTVMAQAIGQRGVFRTVEATLARQNSIGRTLSWREIR